MSESLLFAWDFTTKDTKDTKEGKVYYFQLVRRGVVFVVFVSFVSFVEKSKRRTWQVVGRGRSDSYSGLANPWV